MNGALIGRVRGIEIRVNWSVAIVGWLIAWSLATQMLPEMAEGRSETAYWVAGVIATIGFFAALVAHELGHSLVAQTNGVGVSSITLWVLGGLARLEKQPETPDVAMRIAAAGPAVSVACGVVGLAAASVTSGLAAAVLVWFGSINLLLAGFNLLPAFPLDGGRVYQAWLWKRGRSQDEATAKAASLGSGIGLAMVWLGVIEILFAGLLGGLWLMAIGWFIREASIAEPRGVRRQSMLRRFTAADVMTPNPESVPGSRSIERFVDDVVVMGRHAAYPVRDETQETVGLVELKSVQATPRTAWPTTSVEAVMKPISEIPVAAPEDTVEVLVRSMEEHTATRALIMDGELLAGIVSPSDIARLTIAVELAEGPDAAHIR